MTPRLDFFGIVVSDMARSLVFYRKLGLDFPEGKEDEDHVEAELPGGFRYALDTEGVIRSFDPEGIGARVHLVAVHARGE